MNSAVFSAPGLRPTQLIACNSSKNIWMAPGRRKFLVHPKLTVSSAPRTAPPDPAGDIQQTPCQETPAGDKYRAPSIQGGLRMCLEVMMPQGCEFPSRCRRSSLRGSFPPGCGTRRRSRAPELSRDEIRPGPAWVAGTDFCSH